MNYQETIAYLYGTAPMFQQHGKSAYKANLDNTLLLDAHFNHPHKQFKSLHIAGTNGKGSTSHLLAATLQATGYTVGLYTSPHLKDFRERIRINGEMIPEQEVIDFITANRPLIERIHPSFFEITTMLAFCYFAAQKVDVAVVEVGLGGRLDCTNIIAPELCVITNISLDHTNILGDTLKEIATEKAGIIKHGTPVIIGKNQPETHSIFTATAAKHHAPIRFAEDEIFATIPETDLQGDYQLKNRRTALTALRVLNENGWNIPETAIRKGFANVVKLTQLQGRWQTLGEHPTIICDTGHNESGIRWVCEQLQRQRYNRLHIVFGMMNDKKIDHVLALMPKTATYYFTNANIPRSLNAKTLQNQALMYGLKGNAYASVHEALNAAKAAATPNDIIFIGGSNYIIGEIL